MAAPPSDVQDAGSLMSISSVSPTPDTLTKLVKRLRALTLTLLPVEVDIDSISEPTSRVITPQVISAYKGAAGDFTEALPYCLLRARAEFMWDANHNPADYGENRGRAIACEVLARRIVHLADPDRVKDIMAKRYQHRQIDGDESEMSSALEMAIDQHCTIFLSSSEAQEVVNALWTGDLIQKNNENHDIDYVAYAETREHSFWGHFDPARLSVPRYQNIFRIAVWLFFLVVYSRAVREPLERLDYAHRVLDGWELVLYIMALSFTIEDLRIMQLYILLRFVTWRAFSFWNAIAFVTDTLLLSAFILRVISVVAEGEKEAAMRLRSFQLLSVLAVGFGQGLYALDAADGSTEPPSTVINVLIQALLQWNAVTAIILLNVLISLFSSAYSDVIEDAEAQYLAFFASKTVGMIRAPDSYVYPAPFNLIEAFLVAPLEYVILFLGVRLYLTSPLSRFFPYVRLNEKTYAKLNRYVMGSIFIVPLTLIAFVESTFDRRRHTWMENWFRGNDEGAEDSPANRNPVVDDPKCQGLEISRVPFEELIKVFPNTGQSSEATILKEVAEVKQQLQELLQKLNHLQS
ncbi:hypothetical protein CVT25_011114 [Psilocybe cyanescens]|uniref:YVC1 N-terminal linker helical domain-containing protein n=1 Tax=Psilocybe cyanescens TaxID=93625 RepID=A0A409WGP9_PSICY|nr:hypothetical protein CVT25_011114 [Psilocybe cyanescens]